MSTLDDALGSYSCVLLGPPQNSLSGGKARVAATAPQRKSSKVYSERLLLPVVSWSRQHPGVLEVCQAEERQGSGVSTPSLGIIPEGMTKGGGRGGKIALVLTRRPPGNPHRCPRVSSSQNPSWGPKSMYFQLSSVKRLGFAYNLCTPPLYTKYIVSPGYTVAIVYYLENGDF